MAFTLTNTANVTDNGTLELEGARGVTTAVVGGTTYLFAAGFSDNGVSVFSVAANGALANVFNVTDDATLNLALAEGVTTAVVGGTTYLFVSGFADAGISVFSVAANGALANVFNVNDAGPLELGGAFGVTTAVLGGTTYLFVTGVVDDGISVFSVAANGALANVFNVTDAGLLELNGAANAATAVVGGTTYLFVPGFDDDGVSVFSVAANGALTNVFNVADAGALELDGATELTTAVVGGTTYLFVTGQVDAGVSVFSVAANGALTSVFDVTDAGLLELDGAFGVTTAVLNGTTYLFVAAQVDDGVSVFSVATTGALTNVANLTDAGALELAGATGLTTTVVGGTTYLFVTGQFDNGVSAFSVTSPVTGQLWYSTEGNLDDALVAYVNSDSNASTIVVDNNPTTDLVSGFTADVVLDTAAGLYFVLIDGAQGENARLLMGNIGSAAAPTVVFTFDPTFAGQENNLTFGLHIDPINERLYVGFLEFGPNFEVDNDLQGIRQLTYDPTPVGNPTPVTDNGYIVTQTDAQVQPSAAGASALFIPRDFDIDFTRGVIYTTILALGDGFETNALVRFSLANPAGAAAVSLVNPTLFPLDGDGSDFTTLNGIIQDVEVDVDTDRVYFTTHAEDVEEGGAPGDPEDAIWIVNGASTASNATPVRLTLLPGAFAASFTTTDFYPGDIVLDEVNDVLYVESENSNDVGGGTGTDRILRFQLAADGLSATLIGVIDPAFDQTANIEGMTFDQLAEIGTLSPTATLATEQVTNLDLLTAAPIITDFDGDHLNNATVTISNSFVGSGDDLYALDGATHRISGTFTGTNITVSRTTDGSGNQTLTFTGYDTFANYQTVFNTVTFFANGDNPTNYGNNTTRTVTWQVNDGAAGNPSGTVNGTDTNVRTSTVTIQAVNDAPVNVVPGVAPSVNEDVLTALAGFSVSDVDADPANQDIVVTLSVTNGIIDLLTNVASGITAGDVANNGTGTVTITATQNQINTTFAASGLRYQGNLNFNGGDTLTITTNDQGNTGTDPGLTDGPAAEEDQDTRTITVVAQNDSPDLTNVGAAASSTEQIVALLDTDVLVSDVDLDPLNGGNGLYTGANLTIARNGGANGFDSFGFDTTGALFTVSGGNLQSSLVTFATFTNAGGTLTVNFTSSGTAATSALVDDVLQHVTYQFTGDAPPASATLLYTFNDGSPGNGQGGGPQPATDTGTILVNITAVNDAPVLNAAATPVLNAVNEDSGAPVGAVGTLVSALVDLNPPAGGLDNVTEPDGFAFTGIALTATDTANGSWHYSTDGGTSWFAVGAVTDDAALLLGANGSTRLYFQPNINFSGLVTDAITFRAWDVSTGTNGGTADPTPAGDATAFSTATDTANITVAALNDAPVLNAAATPVLTAVNEDAPAPSGAVGTRILDIVDLNPPAGGNDNVTDADSSPLTGIALTGVDTANGSWFYTLDGGLNWFAVGAVTDDAALLLAADSATRIYFQPTTADFNGIVTDAITFRAWDRSTGANGATADPTPAGGTTAFSTNSDTANITVTAVNDAPALANVDAAAAYTENGAPIALDTAPLIVPSDLDNSTLSSATIAITAGFVPGDVLDFPDFPIPASLAASYDPLTGVLTINAVDTLADYQQVLRGITFASTSDNPGTSRTITWTITDTGSPAASSAAQTTNIAVTPVNDDPVNTAPASVVARPETDTAIAGLAVSDPDAGAGVLTTQLHVDNGILTVASAGGAAIAGSGTDTVTLTGTLAQINTSLSAAGNVIYHGDVGFIGNDTLTTTTNDGGNSGLGGPALDTDLTSISVRNNVLNDFDGDGHSDVFWRDDAGVLVLWEMDGPTISDNTTVNGAIPADWQVLDIADFGGDGRNDVLWEDGAGALVLWEMDGPTIVNNTAAVGGTPLPAYWHYEGAGDISGDGNSDILWRDDTGVLVLWEMDGPNVIGNNAVGNLGLDWQLAEIADVNGDGNSDILWRNDNGTVRLWEMDGPAVIGETDLGTFPGYWHVADSGDYNGDGNADILWRDDAGVLVMWEMDGPTILGNTLVDTVPTTMQVVNSGDYDADGDADILWRDGTAVSLWEMDGPNVINDTHIATIPTYWHIQ